MFHKICKKGGPDGFKFFCTRIKCFFYGFLRCFIIIFNLVLPWNNTITFNLSHTICWIKNAHFYLEVNPFVIPGIIKFPRTIGFLGPFHHRKIFIIGLMVPCFLYNIRNDISTAKLPVFFHGVFHQSKVRIRKIEVVISVIGNSARWRFSQSKIIVCD